MADVTKVFVVLDPTCMEQAALEWGEQIVQEFKTHRSVDATLHVYCCINSESVAIVPGDDAEKAIKATHERVNAWLQRMVTETRDKGYAVDTEVEWSEDWRKAIVAASARQSSALVVKNMTQHSRFVRMVRETSDWTLIRECECPVLLVKTGRPYRVDKMLVAVKHDPDSDLYEQANDNILGAARAWSGDLGAELHAVTCYEEGMHPDRQRFADRCGLERKQVSAAMGSPEKVIAETAAEQGSDLVVIARVARPDSPSMLGNTARKVVDEIDTEVLILPVAHGPIG
ncbi:MAG: universal stress protein [Pseudomonadales bacterium]